MGLSSIVKPLIGGAIGFATGGPPGAAIGAGAALASGMAGDVQADAARDAAYAQTQASARGADLLRQSQQEALTLQRDAMKQAHEFMAPYLEAGTAGGLRQMQKQLPRFINTQLRPLAQKYSQYQTPDLPQFGYQFNTDDPVYQQKLSEMNESVDRFLAKQGLQGSTAGEAFRQKQLKKTLADEESRQYGRATDAYGRDLGSTLTKDQLDRQLMLSQYGLSSDLYNTKYGAARDLANMGMEGARSSAAINAQTGANLSNTALQTGRGLADLSLGAGDAQAQRSLAQGQARAGEWQSLGNVGFGLGAMANMNNGSNSLFQSPFGSGTTGSSTGGYTAPVGGEGERMAGMDLFSMPSTGEYTGPSAFFPAIPVQTQNVNRELNPWNGISAPQPMSGGLVSKARGALQ